MSEPTKTPLHAKLESMGATFEEDGGWLWVESFGDIAKEYNAVRTNAGVWDLSPLIKWEFKGPQAAEAANFVNGNDIVGARVGQVRYGPFLNADGKVVDDGTIYKLADDHLFVMTNGEDHGPYWDEHLSGLDVEITNVARQMPHLSIQGPRSREVVSALTNADVAGLGYFGFIPQPVELGGATGYLARTGFSGEMGYEFFTNPEQIGGLFDKVLDAGVVPFGVGAIYILRLEAGLLIPTLDYDPGETSPFDVGLERFVRMDKDEFLGRTALEAEAANPPHRYKTLKFDGDLPEDGSPVTKDNRPVGQYRTGAESPTYGNIGSAILDREVAVDGETVQVAGTGASVHPWGIYDPEKLRPRG